ncbi:prismalin-14-like [Photinus pyralis]|uniref:prismalin-14-like n=1 Tax=Photinus pyralis TaxID=7054 RepID=UPI001266EC9B|nr:prismalin-14-like [Photinus pyralis]
MFKQLFLVFAALVLVASEAQYNYGSYPYNQYQYSGYPYNYNGYNGYSGYGGYSGYNNYPYNSYSGYNRGYSGQYY